MATPRQPAATPTIVEPAKIRDYLLSPEHPVGRYKASFCTGLHYGSGGTWQLLLLAASPAICPKCWPMPSSARVALRYARHIHSRYTPPEENYRDDP